MTSLSDSPSIASDAGMAPSQCHNAASVRDRSADRSRSPRIKPQPTVLASVRDIVRKFREELQLPSQARAARASDQRGLPNNDIGVERAIDEAVAWLCRSQEHSLTHDGGAARDFSLLSGWASSYPETSGYIVPTLIEYADWRKNESVRACARRMLDWLVSIQFPEGGFQGGKVDANPRVPVTFNTGQILLGLAAGTAAFGNAYREPMNRAAKWLADTQDADGAWRKHPTPFAERGEKAYETHVSWGLLEAARLEPGKGYGEAALRNIKWAIGKQRANGWLADCCLDDPVHPLTHTLGYALRGIVEGWRYSKDPALLAAARLLADGLLSALKPDGYLPGRFDSNWQPAVEWVCLTGSVQIAHSWLILFQDTGNAAYRDAGFAANQFVRRTLSVDGPPEIRGGVKGSFPIDGDYGRYQYLNWPPKFFVDSHWLEGRVKGLW